jgi:hypothetical protein
MSDAKGKKRTAAAKLADEASKVAGELVANPQRQTRNAAKGIVYKPPVKKPKSAPGTGKRGRPKKSKEAAAEPAKEAPEAAEPAA